MIPLQTTSDCKSEMPMGSRLEWKLTILGGSISSQSLARRPLGVGRGMGSRLPLCSLRLRRRRKPAIPDQLAEPAVAQPAAAVQPPVSDTQAAAPPAYPAAREQIAAPENALAMARAAEAKRAAEKRRAERRQLWAEKRRQRQQQELRAVEQKVREDTQPRQFAAEPMRMQKTQFRLFGSE